MSIEVSHETEARVAEETRRQGVSVETLPERLVSESVTVGDTAGVARELPVWRLGDLGSLHRRDIYDDID
jgi:hypothetical protein